MHTQLWKKTLSTAVDELVYLCTNDLLQTTEIMCFKWVLRLLLVWKHGAAKSFFSAHDMSLFSLFVYDLLYYSHMFNTLGYPVEENSQGIGTTSSGVRPSYV